MGHYDNLYDHDREPIKKKSKEDERAERFILMRLSRNLGIDFKDKRTRKAFIRILKEWENE